MLMPLSPLPPPLSYADYASRHFERAAIYADAAICAIRITPLLMPFLPPPRADAFRHAATIRHTPMSRRRQPLRFAIMPPFYAIYAIDAPLMPDTECRYCHFQRAAAMMPLMADY